MLYEANIIHTTIMLARPDREYGFNLLLFLDGGSGGVVRGGACGMRRCQSGEGRQADTVALAVGVGVGVSARGAASPSTKRGRGGGRH